MNYTATYKLNPVVKISAPAPVPASIPSSLTTRLCKCTLCFRHFAAIAANGNKDILVRMITFLASEVSDPSTMLEVIADHLDLTVDQLQDLEESHRIYVNSDPRLIVTPREFAKVWADHLL